MPVELIALEDSPLTHSPNIERRTRRFKPVVKDKKRCGSQCELCGEPGYEAFRAQDSRLTFENGNGATT